MSPLDALTPQVPCSEIAVPPRVARDDQPSTRLDPTEPDEIGRDPVRPVDFLGFQAPSSDRAEALTMSGARSLMSMGEGRVDVVLHDAAGRRVRIDGLDPRHGLTSVLVGKSVWFFGLEATGATRGFDGGRFHPRSFHELPRDRMERRAWALHVFRENETGGGA